MITPEKIEYQCVGLCELLKRKNADYGDSFSEPPYLLPKMFPSTAALVRLSDKFHRLQTLWNSSNRKPETGESFHDTLRDIAGYCVLLLAYADAPTADFGEVKPIISAEDEE